MATVKLPSVVPKVLYIEVKPKNDAFDGHGEEDAPRPKVGGTPPSTLVPPDASGWVKKKQKVGILQTFKKRWIELRDQWLFYYNKQPSPTSKPSGVIDLSGVSVEKSNDPKFSYIISGKFLKHSYHFSHDTAEEYSMWIETIIERSRSRNQLDRNAVLIFDSSLPRPSSQLDLFPASPSSQSSSGRDKFALPPPDKPARKSIGLHDFELLQVIGKGSFAKVLKVRKTEDGHVYAMKILKKSHIIKENMVENTRTERNILQIAIHPFIVSMAYAFQTRKELYLILDFLPGGELFYHLQREGCFCEDRARFYVAELALALEFLHSKGIIYRDLKPENIVLDKYGHVCLTDFGLSKKTQQDQRTFTFCGTPEYLAPEILEGSGHGCSVDWWSLGILLYEMIIGIPPFYSEELQEMYEFIQKKPLEFPPDVEISAECKDLISRFLQRDEHRRLSNASEVKAHPFFNGIDWEALLRKEVIPVFVPQEEEYISQDLQEEPVDPRGIGEDGNSSSEENETEFDGFYFGGGPWTSSSPNAKCLL